MKSLTIFLTSILALVMAVPTQPVAGQANGTSVTGAGAGAFPALTLFNARPAVAL